MVKKSFGGLVIFGMNELVSWGAQPRPLTGLRYTYDWGNSGSDVGLSEFVIMGGSTVGVHSITATMSTRSMGRHQSDLLTAPATKSGKGRQHYQAKICRLVHEHYQLARL